MNFTHTATNNTTRFNLLTAILFWCGLVMVASNYLTIPLMPIFSSTFNVNLTHVAWTGTAFSLCYAAGCLFTGPLSDRFGRKQVMLIGLILITAITLVIPLINTLSWVIVWRSLQGIAASTFAPVVVAYVVDQFPLEKRVTAIGFISSSFLISAVFGQILSSFISQQLNWQSVFYAFGIIYLVTAIIAFYQLPSSSIQQKNINIKSMFDQFYQLLTDKRLLQVYTIALTLLLSFVAFYSILGEYLMDTFSLSEDGVLYVRVIGIIGMLFAPFSGKLTGHFGFLTILRTALIIAVVGMISVSLLPQLTLVVLMSILFVTGIALTVPTLISLVGQLGGQYHGAAVSLYTFILFVGASLGPMAAVFLLNNVNYTLSFIILAGLLSFSLMTAFSIKN